MPFDLKKAWGEVVSDFSYGSNLDKAGAVAKLIGKTLFNAGSHAIESAPEYTDKTKERLEKSEE